MLETDELNEIDDKLAKEMCKLFLELVIAPSFSKGALKIFSFKKNLRLLQTKKLNFNLYYRREFLLLYLFYNFHEYQSQILYLLRNFLLKHTLFQSLYSMKDS